MSSFKLTLTDAYQNGLRVPASHYAVYSRIGQGAILYNRSSMTEEHKNVEQVRVKLFRLFSWTCCLFISAVKHNFRFQLISRRMEFISKATEMSRISRGYPFNAISKIVEENNFGTQRQT